MNKAHNAAVSLNILRLCHVKMQHYIVQEKKWHGNVQQSIQLLNN